MEGINWATLIGWGLFGMSAITNVLLTFLFIPIYKDVKKLRETTAEQAVRLKRAEEDIQELMQKG